MIMSDILSINVATQQRLKEVVLPMLYTLLSSKESESKAGGLNILGSSSIRCKMPIQRIIEITLQ